MSLDPADLALAPTILATLTALTWAGWHIRNRRNPMTHTRTHTYITFANPHLVCDLCRQPVTRWHNNTKCGCTKECWLDPCDHNAEAVSVCPSWDPVDGCQCEEYLGRVDHAPAPEARP